MRVHPTSDDDSARFRQCVATVRTFTRSGPYAVHLLNRVLPNILKHYGASRHDVLRATGAALDRSGTVVRPFQDMDDGNDPMF